MQAQFQTSIESILSTERLGAYGADHPGAEVVLARYLWNMALCESLYSPLQLCEVALRNSIHLYLSRLFGREDWFDDARFQLMPWAVDEVQKAKDKISRTGKPVNTGRVVAELQFGFWTSLFEYHYERYTPFLPGAFKGVFPRLPKSLHHRKDRKNDLELIRGLRNRVFHHERILHWKDLDKKHALILSVISWISPELHHSRARRRFRHGDTVLSTVRPDRGSYFLALNPPENRVASTGFAVLTPTKTPWSFIHAAMTLPEVSDHLGQMADGGAYPAVRPEIIGAMKVPVPNEPKILEVFHRTCAPLFEKAEANRIQSRTLATLRDTLLPKLLSGELSVVNKKVSKSTCATK